jgi:NADH-quinone oxidoreductase subunit F
MGATLRLLLELAGGMKDGIPLKFWTPGGSSTPLFTAEHMDVPLDFEGAAAAGSMLGTTAVQIFNETVSVPWAVMKWTQFYEHESCGKCTPCREGTYWLAQILERMLHGQGTAGDVETMLDVCDNILGRSFCALGDGATSPITSGIKYFRQEFLDLVAAQPVVAHPDQLPELAGAAT